MSITTLLRGSRVAARPVPPVVYEPYRVVPAASAAVSAPVAPTVIAAPVTSKRRAHWSVSSERVLVTDDDLFFI